MKWKYFSDKEADRLVPDLMYKLDRAREFYRNPIVITSGFRTQEENARLPNSVPDSAHLTGRAVDIRAPQTPSMRERLAWALGSAGFRRVFAYPKHFHVDVDIMKPYPAFGELHY